MSLVIDCNSCSMRFKACGDCFVSTLIAADAASESGTPVQTFDEVEVAAVRALTQFNLVPDLQYQPGQRAAAYHESHVPSQPSRIHSSQSKSA